MYQHLVEFNYFAWGFVLGGLVVYVWQNWATVEADVTVVKTDVTSVV